MLFVERNEFGLNELLGASPTGEAPPRAKLLRSGARWKPGVAATVRADGLACQTLWALWPVRGAAGAGCATERIASGAWTMRSERPRCLGANAVWPKPRS